MVDASTTIGKYIARFRRERPRPREQRADVRAEDFWWVRAGHSEGPQGEPRAAPRTMDWEVELLSEAASSRSGDSARESAASRSWDAASLQTSDATPLHEEASSATRENRFARDVAQELSLDEEFVLLPSRSGTPAHHGQSETLSYEDASLDDPEIVIQRIRRRLGFEAHAARPTRPSTLSVFVETPFVPEQLPLYSPLHDEQLQMAELSLSGLEPSALSQELQPSESASQAPSLPSLILDGISSDESNTATKIETSSGPTSPREDEATGAVDAGETVPVSHGVVEDAAAQEETELLKRIESDVASNAEPLSAATTLNEEGATESSSVSTPTEEEENAHDVGIMNEDLLLQDSLQSDGGDTTTVTSIPLTPIPSPKSTAESDRKNSGQRKIKRLPPLSPARSPQVRPSLPPRSASVDAEIPVETAQTLDSLLSFVVHAWGDDSPDSTTARPQSKIVGDMPSTDTVPTDTVPTQAEREGTSDVSSQVYDHRTLPASATQSSSVCNDSEALASFSDDSVVSLLHQRIEVFERALRILEERELESAHGSQNEGSRSI